MKKSMPKAIPLKRDTIAEILEELTEMADSGEIESIVFAGLLKDGNVFTAVDADLIEQHTLIGYLHSSAIVNTIQLRFEEE